MSGWVRLVVLGIAFAVGFAGSRGSIARNEPAARGLIVYWNDSQWPTIFSIRPDGSRIHRILRNRQNAKRPRLSPARRWVAFDGSSPGTPPLSDFDIQLVRLDGADRRTLTRSRMWDHDAQWSPDGRLIAFSRMPPHHADATESTIWIMRRDGSGLRRLVRGSDARWSPDGKRLVFTAPTGASDGDLFVIGRDGSGRRRLTATRPIEAAAAWSPDGKRILLTRFAGSASDVFVMKRQRRALAAARSRDGGRLVAGRLEDPLYVLGPLCHGRGRLREAKDRGGPRLRSRLALTETRLH